MRKLVIYSILLLFVYSCGQTGKVASDETPTRGKINIGVDNSFKLLFDTEIFTFESIYKNAHITPIYKPELDILTDFIKDSVRIIVTGKKLTKEEIEYLKSKDIYPRTTHIAYDAIALITNKGNIDSLLTLNQVKDIFLGKTTKWTQINSKSNLGNISIVFDDINSGNAEFISQKFDIKEFPSSCAALKDNEAVISYVESHKNAIGIVSVNWISDRQDSISHSFLSKINVLALSNEIQPDGPLFYRPHQGSVADKSYPLIREIYIINRETFSGLGTGFSSFVAGEKGQRIILKAGMVPAVMPIRFVQLKKEF